MFCRCGFHPPPPTDRPRSQNPLLCRARPTKRVALQTPTSVAAVKNKSALLPFPSLPFPSPHLFSRRASPTNNTNTGKSLEALKRCDNDPHVITAVARRFWADRKYAKARKWFNRAITLDPNMGDAWAAYYAFELQQGTEVEQADVLDRCEGFRPQGPGEAGGVQAR